MCKNMNSVNADRKHVDQLRHAYLRNSRLHIQTSSTFEQAKGGVVVLLSHWFNGLLIYTSRTFKKACQKIDSPIVSWQFGTVKQLIEPVRQLNVRKDIFKGLTSEKINLKPYESDHAFNRKSTTFFVKFSVGKSGKSSLPIASFAHMRHCLCVRMTHAW